METEKTIQLSSSYRLSTKFMRLVMGTLGLVIYTAMLPMPRVSKFVSLYGHYTLWVKSPTGKTIKEFPFFDALRIVRKHKWALTDVEPIKPSLNRWQHLKCSLGQ